MTEMRGKDKELQHDEIIKILQGNHYGVLSTISDNGYPYGVPLTYIYHDGNIYFHCALSGHKVKNIESNSKVSFCVVGKTELLQEHLSTNYESVIAFGQIKEIEDSEKAAILKNIVKTIAPKFFEKGNNHMMAANNRVRVFCMNIEEMTGKARS